MKGLKVSKYTPGPWTWDTRVVNGWGRGGLWGPNGEEIVTDVEGWDSQGIKLSDNEMDGRLIEAAVDMYEALKAMYNEYEGVYDSVDGDRRYQSDEAKAAETKTRVILAKIEEKNDEASR